jgi:hypothetical protein
MFTKYLEKKIFNGFFEDFKRFFGKIKKNVEKMRKKY